MVRKARVEAPFPPISVSHNRTPPPSIISLHPSWIYKGVALSSDLDLSRRRALQ